MTLSEELGLIIAVVSLLSSFAAIVAKFKELEHAIKFNRNHLQSHCMMIEHIGVHLSKATGYQPLTKLDYLDK